MEHMIDFDRLDETPPDVLDGLRGAIVLKLSENGLTWSDGVTVPSFGDWCSGRKQDDIDDAIDDIDTLRAVERALGKGQTRH